MGPAAARAGPPPLSALIPIEKNGSPQGVTSQATRWRASRRQREPGAWAKSRQAGARPGLASRRAAATRAGWTNRRTCRIGFHRSDPCHDFVAGAGAALWLVAVAGRL